MAPLFASAIRLKNQRNFAFFELVYFARPDSQIRNGLVYEYRMALGEQLAKQSIARFPQAQQADVVIPVPDSGNVAAVGYSQASGIPYMEGLIKNRYVGRTFIHPTQSLRERSIQIKLNPMDKLLRGKNIVVVDDSIVRGNTSKKLVAMLKECGHIATIGYRNNHIRLLGLRKARYGLLGQLFAKGHAVFVH
jgi:amidophosphoribosyltransferase